MADIAIYSVMQNVPVPEVAAFDEISDQSNIREPRTGSRDVKRDHSRDSLVAHHRRTKAQSIMYSRNPVAHTSVR